MQLIGLVGSFFGGGGGGLGGGGGGFGIGQAAIPGFAKGGILPSTGPAIVGENGPELAFSKGGQTAIVPFGDAFSDARSSMGGSRSADEAFDENGESIATRQAFVAANNSVQNTNSIYDARAYEAAMQSGTNNQQVDIRLEEVVVNGMTFTTPEQTKAAVAAGVKQATAKVYSDLKNRPSRRASIGMN